MDCATIKLAIDGPVGTLTLNRPEALNSLSPEMLGELAHALERVEQRAGVKALVIRGEGSAFCTGADLNYLEGAVSDPPLLDRYLQQLNALFFRLEELPLPVIGVVHGFALAGGLELLLACDLVIAAEDARIGDQHANYGLMPGGGSTPSGCPANLAHRRRWSSCRRAAGSRGLRRRSWVWC